MHKISCNGDEVYILKNFLSNKECDKYFKMIDDIGYNAKPIPWEERAVEITTDPIVDKVTKYINERFNLNLIVEQAETQNHNINSYSVFHVHDHEVRKHIVYNSLLYLNDNFEGGETIFPHFNFKTKVETGSVLLFPCSWSYLHKGNPVKKGHAKYVLGTFLNYIDGQTLNRIGDTTLGTKGI